MTRGRVKPATAVLAVAMVVLLGVFGYGYVQWQARVAEATAGGSELRIEKEPEPPVMLVVGDSYVGGSDMNQGPTWPDLIGVDQDWLVLTDAIGGTGYVQGRPKTNFSAPTRIPTDVRNYAPDMVILAGGINDQAYPTAEVLREARMDARALVDGFPRARIVMLSPYMPSGATPALAQLRDGLAGVAHDLGVTFIDTSDFLTGATGLIGSDGVHPTDAGHAALAQKIAARLPSMP